MPKLKRSGALISISAEVVLALYVTNDTAFFTALYLLYVIMTHNLHVLTASSFRTVRAPHLLPELVLLPKLAIKR